MSPGPLSSAHRGGLTFQHGGGRHAGGNYGQRFGAPIANRGYGAQPAAHRERFYFDGQGHGMLEAGDKLTVTIDDDGNTVVSVTGPDNGDNGNGAEEAAEGNGNNGNGNGAEEESKRRGLSGRRDKMAVSSNSDGTITIRPEGDASLQLIGDPLSGAVVVVEIEPQPLEVVDGRY